MLQWFKNACDQNIEGITELFLLEKAQSLGEQQRFSEIDCTKINIGWIKRWKKSHSITRKRIIGEAGDVTNEMTTEWYTDVLPNILQLFHENDIFNMDEAGLFWKLLPDSTHTFKDRKCVGGKKSKERITVLIGSNMSGNEKLPILVIGKFAKPRCFKNVRSLPDNIIYRHSKRAWMTTNLFQEYIYNLDVKFSQQKRKVAIIIDNCPAHPVLTNLKSIEMIRLPKNTTSKTQPMDAGVIKQLKGNYRRLLSRKRIHSFDTKIDFSVNLLDSINFIHTAWSQIPSTHIANCFRHAGFKKMIQNQSTCPFHLLSWISCGII